MIVLLAAAGAAIGPVTIDPAEVIRYVGRPAEGPR